MADKPEAARGGRPKGSIRVDEPGSPVTTWLRQSEHDRLIALANKHETSVSALLARIVRVKIR